MIFLSRRAPRQLWRAFLPLAVAAAIAPTSVAAAQAATTLGPVDGKDMAPTDIERIAVGMAAPDFTLTKFGGGTTTLSSMRGKKNVVLVFYRGFWCPYCVAQLKEMRTMLTDEMKKGTEVVVVSIDDEKGTESTIAKVSADGVKPEFTFLSDPEHTVIGRYGILNPAGSRRGIPHPATYVIDKKGVVKWRDVQTDYKIRPTNAQVLAAVQALPTR